MSKTKTPYKAFEENNGVWVCSLPKEITTYRDIYLLLQKAKVGDGIDVSGFKLASQNRVDLVHEHSLTGIPIESVDSPPFRHGFSNEVEFYRIKKGQEWDFALRDGVLSFFDYSGLKGARAFLFWRDE